MCAPPYFEQAKTLAGQSTGDEWALGSPFEQTANSSDGTRSVVESPSDSDAAQPDDEGGARGSSSEGGCSLAPSGSAGGAWLLSLLALLGIVRRRQS